MDIKHRYTIRCLAIILAVLFTSGLMLSAVMADAGPRRHKRRVFKRHHHPRGHIVKVLPSSKRIVRFGGAEYFFAGGLFYRSAATGFVVVTAPIGAIITALPVGFGTIMIGGRPHFFHNGVYYRKVPKGYIVVDAPPGAIAK